MVSSPSLYATCVQGRDVQRGWPWGLPVSLPVLVVCSLTHSKPIYWIDMAGFEVIVEGYLGSGGRVVMRVNMVFGGTASTKRVKSSLSNMRS